MRRNSNIKYIRKLQNLFGFIEEPHRPVSWVHWVPVVSIVRGIWYCMVDPQHTCEQNLKGVSPEYARKV